MSEVCSGEQTFAQLRTGLRLVSRRASASLRLSSLFDYHSFLEREVSGLCVPFCFCVCLFVSVCALLFLCVPFRFCVCPFVSVCALSFLCVPFCFCVCPFVSVCALSFLCLPFCFCFILCFFFSIIIAPFEAGQFLH